MYEGAEGVMAEVAEELRAATQRFASFNSSHEGCAVIREEFEELWDHVKVDAARRSRRAMRQEAIQVAAMAVRFVLDVCDS